MNAATRDFEVSVEAGAGLERRMTVRVPVADIEREVTARLGKVRRTAKLKGFRPGKAPEKVVRQYYGGQVRDEVRSDVVRSTFTRAIEEQKLNPAGGPRIEALSETGGEHFGYRAIFEVYPEIALGELEALRVKRPQVAVGEPDVDAMIEKLRLQRAEWRAAERAAQAGDRVVVDFTGRVDGEPFDGGQAEDASIVVGAGQVLPEFDQALAGAAAGETREAKVQFPAEYPAKNLANKEAAFDIAVKTVEEQVLPDVDEDFAAAFGVSEGGPDALRVEVRKNMERELAERLKTQTKSRVFNALLAANDVTVPRSLVEDEIDTLQADAMRQMSVKDPSKAPPRDRFRDLAARRVTIGLLVQELVKRHEIKPDRQRVERRIEELAAPYEKPEEAAQYYRGNRQTMAQIESVVFEDQVVDFLLEKAKVEDEPIEFQAFMGAQK
jgi:trigger factor